MSGEPVDRCHIEHAIAARRVCTALPRYAYRYGNEVQLHEGLAAALEKEGIVFSREVTSDADRFDFLCEGGVVIEAKIGGSATAAIRQAERYCAHDEVTAVVIASTRAWRGDFAGLTLRGKAIHVVQVRAQSF
jgi:hypothetical protein